MDHNSEKTLYLIDISSFIFRAFYGVRPLNTPSGEPANAVFGVAQMLFKLIESESPKHIAVVYDSKEPSFRSEIFTEYKANRSEPPEDLIPQFARIEQLVASMGLPAYRQAGLEADDIIATLAREWERTSGHNAVIVSGDKDLMQLVTPRTQLWDTMNDKRYGPAEVKEKMGVPPERVRDLLALVGDAVDNVPGVAGVGPKTAIALLEEHQHLEGVLLAAQAGKISGKRGETLKSSLEVARLSYALVGLKDDLALNTRPEDLLYAAGMRAECVAFLRQMGFNSLVKKWEGKVVEGVTATTGGPRGVESSVSVSQANDAASDEQDSAPSIPSTWTPTILKADSNTFRCIQTQEAFREVLKQLAGAAEFAIDLETTSLDPREAQVVGVSLCWDSHFGVYIPVGHNDLTAPQLAVSEVLDQLKPLLTSARHKKVGQNLKYDASVLQAHGIELDGIGADTMVAAYVVDPTGRHNMDFLAQRYLGYSVLTYEEVCGKGKAQISFADVPVDRATRYSAEDAWVTYHLWKELKPRLEREGLMRIFAEVDLPLVPVLRRMEMNGIAIDVPYLHELSQEFQKEIHAIDAKIQRYTPEPVNLNSPKQLAELLFNHLKLPTQGKTKTGFSTDAEVLETLAPLHEVPRLLLEYREIAKLKGTYVDPLPALMSKRDGRIHTSFHQAVTATGRLSSTDPNLQNIPIRSERGRRIRRAFVAPAGSVLMSADYSQIELRILAAMSGDAELMRSFRADEDVHRRTASEIFSVSMQAVNEDQRAVAKAINFGLMYGKTPFGLAQELGISRTDAKAMIDRYFARYAGVKAFLDGLIAGAKEQGYVCTFLGRRRALPDIQSRNPAVRANAERMAMNTPIQGTAADLIKIAMAQLDERLREGKYQSKMLLQVHDELVLECPAAEVDEVTTLTVRTLEHAMDLGVPLKVNAGHAQNWLDC